MLFSFSPSFLPPGCSDLKIGVSVNSGLSRDFLMGVESGESGEVSPRMMTVWVLWEVKLHWAPWHHCVHSLLFSRREDGVANQPHIPGGGGGVSLSSALGSLNLTLLSFFKIYLLIMLLQLSHFPPPLTSLPPAHPLPPTLPPIAHVHGSYPQVPGFYISYPPPVYFPPIIYATYSLHLSPHSPPPAPLLTTLHVISISMVLFLS